MGFLKRRSRLELLALLALLATIASIAIVATGVLHQRPEKTAARLTALCAPIATAITNDDPEEVTRRETLRLRQESAAAARGVDAVIKDAKRDLRRRLLAVQGSLEQAGGGETWLTVEIRARWLGEAAQDAAAIGARCPSPITQAEGRAIDQNLKAKTGRTGNDAPAGPQGGAVLP
jgi:hypothetical protein